MEVTRVSPARRATSQALQPVGGVLSNLQREVDQLFQDFAQVAWPSLLDREARVRLDVAETRDRIEVTAELPGLEEKDVQVTVAGNVLTIEGEKHSRHDEEDKNYRLIERSYGAFSRSITLPSDIMAEKVSADMANGVLKILVPRSAPAEVRKIEVRTPS